jgi:hypothetical protein
VLVVRVVVVQALVRLHLIKVRQEFSVKAMLVVVALMVPQVRIKVVVAAAQVLLEMGVLVYHQEPESVVLDYQPH